MATTPEPAPLAPPEPPAPRRRSPLRRLAKGLLYGVLALVLLLALIVGLLHTGPGKDLVRGVVEDGLAERFHGTVTLGELDYALFGDVTLGDLEVVDPQGHLALRVAHLTARLDWGSLLGGPPALDLVQVDGVTFDAARFAPLQKAPAQLPDALVVRAMDVNHVDITLTAPDGTVTTLTDLALRGSASFDLPARTADLAVDTFSAAVALTRPDGTRVSLPLATGLDARLRGEDLTLVTRALTSTVTVARADAPPLTLPLTVGELALTAGRAAAHLDFAGLSAGPVAIAKLTADLRLGPDGLPAGEQALHLDGLTLTAATANALIGQTLLRSDLRADLSIAGPPAALVPRGTVRTDGGTLTLGGTVDLSDLAQPRYDLRLDGADIDSSRLIATTDPPLRTSFTLTLRGRGLRPGAADAALRLAVGPTDLGGRPLDGMTLDLTAAGDRLTLDALTLTAFGQTFTLDGHLDRATRAFAARLRTSVAAELALAKARDAGLLLVPLPPVAGALDLDLVAEGTLRGPLPAEAPPAAPLPAAPLDPFLLDRLPIERLTLTGHAKGRDLALELPAGPVRLGALAAAIDLALAQGKPTGRLDFSLDGLVAPRATLDEGRLTVTIDGLDQRFELVAKDAAQRLDAHAVLTSKVDLDARAADTTLERLDLTRGAFRTHLLAPVTVHVAPPDARGEQAFTLPPLRLAVAGGEARLEASARFARDPEHPEATRLTSARAELDLDDLGLGALAALAGRPLRGLGGTLSGHLAFQGTPEAPDAGFSLRVRAGAKGADAAVLTASGAVHDAQLTTELRLTSADRRALLGEARLRAPLALAPGRPPALAPGGALSVDLALPERRLGALAAFLPGGLPAGLDPDATVTARATFRGTPARPKGDFALALAGRLVPPALAPTAGPAQRLTLDGALAPDASGKIRLTGRLSATLDAAAAPLLDLLAEGDFQRSPLLPGALARDWHLALSLSPLDLARLPQPSTPAGPVSGTVSGHLDLSGSASDLFAHGGVSARHLQAPGAPATDLVGTFTLGADAATVDLRLDAGGAEALTLLGRVGVPGRGLRAALARPARLLDSPLELTLTVPKRSLAAWSALASSPLALPGDVGGALAVRGTLGAPQLEGALAWDGFTTLAGTPGRAALAVRASRESAELALELGPLGAAGAAPFALSVGLPVADVLARRPATLTLAGRAADVDLLGLVPDALVAGRRVDVAGRLAADLDGRFALVPDAGGFRLDPAASRLQGGLTVEHLALGLPGTERRFHDGRLRLEAALTGAGFVLELYERDLQRDDRKALVAGGVVFEDLRPTEATLRIDTERFLVPGTEPASGLDNPDGELDLGLVVKATRLGEPVKDIDVLVEHVVMRAPDRFVRLHAPQYASWGDVLFLDATGRPSGVLPSPPPKAAPAPAPAAAPTDGPPSGFDVHLRIPEPLDVVRDPLTMKLAGRIDATVRGGAVHADGRLDVLEGAINVMGWSWPLVEGGIAIHGGLETFLARFAFARPPHAAALRDAAVAGRDHEGQVSITVSIDLVRGQQVSFAGVGGAYLLDAATVLNTGRALRWSMADLPASENVQFGQLEQGLINTFVQTNLRNLIFADRANGWSDPVDDHAQYGRIWNFEAERYLAGDTQRLRFVTRPPALGQNRLEVQYDLLFDTAPRSVFGAGARLGSDLRLGLGLFWEFVSAD